MEIKEIFLNILDKPNIPKFYKELITYYLNNNMLDEANGIKYLIEQKFVDNPSNNSK